MNKKPITVKELAKIGGEAKFKKVGREGMSEMAKKAGEINKAKGSEYFRKIRKIGIEKRKREEKTLNKYSKLFGLE